jgi:hypothetical protein
MKTISVAGSKVGERATVNQAGAGKGPIGRRNVVCRRSKIEVLLGGVTTPQLADLWRQLYPLPVESDRELPDRRALIDDLADFGQTLQPNTDGLTADQLCRLVGKCGRLGEVMGPARKRRQALPDRLFERLHSQYRHGCMVRIRPRPGGRSSPSC